MASSWGGSLNLDPDSYSVDEICGLLGVPVGASRSDVAEAREVLAKQLRAVGNTGLAAQGDIALFLDTITGRVLNASTPAVSGKEGTWSQPWTPTTQHGSNIIITNADAIAGRDASITAGRAANSGSAPPGHLNPINVRTLMHAVNIDSRFRPDYFTTSSTDFRMELPDVQKKVVSIRVGSMELPLTFYAISESLGNAYMLLVDSSGPDPKSMPALLIRVPDGNYEQSWVNKSRAAHIELAVNNAITNAQECTFNSDTGLAASGAAGAWTAPRPGFEVDRASGRSMFAFTAQASPRDFYFNIAVTRAGTRSEARVDPATNLQLRLGWQLGFRAAKYTLEPSAGDGICSEAPCHISGPRYGFLSIDDHQRNASSAFTVAFGESFMDTNIISRINLAPSLSRNGVFQSIDAPGLTTSLNRTREYFGPVDIQRLDVRLVDEYGRVINLNAVDWSFSLAFEKLYD